MTHMYGIAQEMTCRQRGSKPSPEPMLACRQLDPEEQIWVKF